MNIKPRKISETQRVRALSLGLKIVDAPEVTVTYTEHRCRVETSVDLEGNEIIVLSTSIRARE